MLYSVYCQDAEDTAALREQHLKEHREYLDAWRDQIFFSGPLQSDDARIAHGSLFILNVEDRGEAERFIHNETFYKAGIFDNWYYTPGCTPCRGTRNKHMLVTGKKVGF